ncbi:expansin-like protein [Gelatoporia subvermispora B]|uniref:Expansin-like protein n=1 Tax=Ceriporiopsis subvermispora (strain B) TaxID=914234 RepID=M2R073_CERS8|nr:expansin-like protein [Gelatoporia subvermispora B]
MSTFTKAVFAAVVSSLYVASASAYTGEITYYNTDNGVGACGTQLSDSGYTAALSSDVYDNGAHCGQSIQIQWQGNTVTATVEDLCPGCDSTSVDLTPTAFEALAPTSVGVLSGATWNFT